MKEKMESMIEEKESNSKITIEHKNQVVPENVYYFIFINLFFRLKL